MERYRRIIAGMGRMLDSSGSYRFFGLRGVKARHEALRRRTDSEALASDWEKIGADLGKALGRAESVHAQR